MKVLDLGDGALHVATSAGVRHGRHADGRHWLAIADLISGDLEDTAAGTATAPQRQWRGVPRPLGSAAADRARRVAIVRR